MNDRLENELRRGPGADAGVGEATNRLLERALDEGLVSVAYARTDSPFGDLLVATTPRGIVRIGFLHTETEESVVGRLAERLSPRVLHAPARLDDARRQLEQYFEGHRR